MLPQSTQINKAEVTDTKPDQMSDQPEEEYGFMEPMTLDSDDEDEVENVPKSVPEIVPEIVPNRQKSPEPENDAQDEEDVLNIESITIDSENKDEVKIEVKEDKTPQVLGFPTGQNFLVLHDNNGSFVRRQIVASKSTSKNSSENLSNHNKHKPTFTNTFVFKTKNEL